MKLYLARDKVFKFNLMQKTGELWLYTHKPVLKKESGEEFWGLPDSVENGDCIQIDPKLYPEVTFENSPMKVELILKQ